MLKSIVVAVALILGITGCARNSWETQYEQLNPVTTANWRVADVRVNAPQTLTTTEVNSYVPDADIVWHGDPQGDRRAQAAAIVAQGIRDGASGLRGGQPVVINATISQFHALTPKARAMEGNVGVHDIRYTVTVTDARTGETLIPAQEIRADKAALVGVAATDADARGFTQKVEITQHLAAVTRHWLGLPSQDPRGAFNRTGR
ncbi:MAG: hypothetical protein Q4G22_04535 [Paracoccus sp. (in: a-proteobacteria)]|uniref:DUF6778 family protein n=1 Tax=Paracoccus sp. TaxID=267 RepID=UPI0026DF36F1|nr:DUF6778 family protein [Paracoccus sp. (in: a-proteobacteria)]MDO5631086.1 hypothetical protein [Paracoccus sp. (in: a-proteobacteria)]